MMMVMMMLMVKVMSSAITPQKVQFSVDVNEDDDDDGGGDFCNRCKNKKSVKTLSCATDRHNFSSLSHEREAFDK